MVVVVVKKVEVVMVGELEHNENYALQKLVSHTHTLSLIDSLTWSFHPNPRTVAQDCY